MKKLFVFLLVLGLIISCKKPDFPSLSDAPKNKDNVIQMEPNGNPVEDGVDYGFWTYRATYQDDEISAIGSAEAITSANKTKTLERVHAMAKQKILDAISHKAVPGSIQYELAYEEVNTLKSQNDLDSFVSKVQSKANSISNGATAVSAFYGPAGVVAIAAKAISKIAGYFRSFASIFGWGSTTTTRAYAVAYTARYKVNISGLQVVGPGIKNELKNRIPSSYINEEGKNIVTFDFQWNPLPYMVQLHTGFATYTYDETEMQETPEYVWDLAEVKGAINANVFRKVAKKSNKCLEVVFQNKENDTGLPIALEKFPINWPIPGVADLFPPVWGNNWCYTQPFIAAYGTEKFPHIPNVKKERACTWGETIALENPCFNKNVGHIIITETDQSIFRSKILAQKKEVEDNLPTTIIKKPKTLTFVDTSEIKVGAKAKINVFCVNWSPIPNSNFERTCLEYDSAESDTEGGIRIMSGKVGFKYQYELYTQTVEAKSRIGERVPIINEIENHFKTFPNQKPRYVKFFEYTGTQLVTYSYEWDNGKLVQIGQNAN